MAPWNKASPHHPDSRVRFHTVETYLFSQDFAHSYCLCFTPWYMQRVQRNVPALREQFRTIVATQMGDNTTIMIITTPNNPAETISLDKHWFNVLYLVGILWGETQNSARKIQSHSSCKNKLYGLNFYVVTGILPYILLMNAWRWSRIAIRYVWRHCEVYPTPRRHFSLFRLLIEFELLLERDVYSWG